MRKVLFPLVLASGILAGCSWFTTHEETPHIADEAEMQAGLIADGQAIVEKNCTACHAVGLTGESPRYDAPLLRNVLTDRDVEALRDDFREGIHVGADDMPDFDFGPLGTDAVIAYIESIQEGAD